MALTVTYNLPAETRAVLEQLATETKSKGWWHSYGDVVPTWFELYVALEQTAHHIRTFEPWLVPGLLQDTTYMELALLAYNSSLTPEQVAALVEVRKSRQLQLTRAFPQPPRLDVIIAEPALLPQLPDGIMRAQLWRLLKATELPNVSLRVLPLSAGLHQASVAGAFVLLDFPFVNGTTPPSTVYIESQTGAIYLDKPRELETYDQAWSSINSQALDQDASVELISQKLKELNDRES